MVKKMPVSQRVTRLCERQNDPQKCIQKYAQFCDDTCVDMDGLELCDRLCSTCKWHCNEPHEVMGDFPIPGSQCNKVCWDTENMWEEEDIAVPAGATTLGYRRNIPLMVYRNPRKLFNFAPIQQFMYGEITGIGTVDSVWENAGTYAIVDVDDEVWG